MSKPFVMSAKDPKTVEKFIARKRKENKTFRKVSEITPTQTRKGTIYSVKYENGEES